MSEYDITHIGHAEAQEIINWAIRAGGALQLLNAADPVSSSEDLVERYAEFSKWIGAMVDDMPTMLGVVSASAMSDAVERAVEDEIAIADFREQLDSL